MANAENLLGLSQLLSSRLCHDLISPVSAIGSGLELLEESGPDFLDDALPLISRSASQSKEFLAFYRAAFGMGGAPGDWREVRALAENFLVFKKITLSWDEGGPYSETMMPKDQGRFLLNLIMLGAETLLVGGDIQVQMAVVEGGLGMGVAAQGSKVVLRDDLKQAMTTEIAIAELSARTVQAHYLALLAGGLGGQLEITNPHDGRIEIAALLPA